MIVNICKERQAKKAGKTAGFPGTAGPRAGQAAGLSFLSAAYQTATASTLRTALLIVAPGVMSTMEFVDRFTE
jgi:hypothetical protein